MLFYSLCAKRFKISEKYTYWWPLLLLWWLVCFQILYQYRHLLPLHLHLNNYKNKNNHIKCTIPLLLLSYAYLNLILVVGWAALPHYCQNHHPVQNHPRNHLLAMHSEQRLPPPCSLWCSVWFQLNLLVIFFVLLKIELVYYLSVQSWFFQPTRRASTFSVSIRWWWTFHFWTGFTYSLSKKCPFALEKYNLIVEGY